MKWVLVIIYMSGTVGVKNAPNEAECSKLLVRSSIQISARGGQAMVKCMRRDSDQFKRIMALVRKDEEA